MNSPKIVQELVREGGAGMADIKFEMWFTAKRNEHDAIFLRPHPFEFSLHHDV